MFLFVDGLLLDRFRHLVKKVTKLPLSFGPAFKQGLIFQNALKRVVEVNVPLHMAFHMLQTIFAIFQTSLSWRKEVLQGSI